MKQITILLIEDLYDLKLLYLQSIISAIKTHKPDTFKNTIERETIVGTLRLYL